MKPFFLLFFAAWLSCQPHVSTTSEIPPVPSLQERIRTLGLDEQDLEISLHISKKDYQLTVRFDSLPLKTYPVVFGGDPVNDKRRQGDQCTPEGRFEIRDHYPHRKWKHFMWLNYPTADSWAKHKAAKAAGEIPANATIGGEIGIHGVPEGYDYAIDNRQNWTLGCISLKNADLMEIVPLVEKGTVIWIE